MASTSTRTNPASTDPTTGTAVLITGAGGEVGHGLIHALHAAGRQNIIAMDLRELDAPQRRLCRESFVGDIRNHELLREVLFKHEVSEVYHLAALLSSHAEQVPAKAHEVNVNGTLNLLQLAAERAALINSTIKFIFPSSIAVYGLPDLATKELAGAVTEDLFTSPITMYGCNKLYCEHLGRYFTRHFQPKPNGEPSGLLDFRSLRFPGIISAETVPSGGTSDFAPEMIHKAIEGKPYACFVRADSRIPFVTMPDAIEALLALATADASRLTRCVYNVGSFNPSAGEVAEIMRSHVPDASITFEPTAKRQAIVDTWPAAVDDSAARRDWGYAPRHDLTKAFDEYLIPRITARYA